MRQRSRWDASICGWNNSAPSLLACGCELLQVADHPRLEACEQRHPPGGALEAGGSPHRQTGAIRLRLQQRIGGRGATIHRQFTQAAPEGLFGKLHQRRYRQGDPLKCSAGDVTASAVTGEAHQNTACLGIPVRCPPAGEGGHEHHPPESGTERASSFTWGA